MIDNGNHVMFESVITTTGLAATKRCRSAIHAHTVCQPVAIVVVHSPSFHGVIQILKCFGVKALEIPTDPLTGISLETL